MDRNLIERLMSLHPGVGFIVLSDGPALAGVTAGDLRRALDAMLSHADGERFPPTASPSELIGLTDLQDAVARMEALDQSYDGLRLRLCRRAVSDGHGGIMPAEDIRERIMEWEGAAGRILSRLDRGGSASLALTPDLMEILIDDARSRGVRADFEEIRTCYLAAWKAAELVTDADALADSGSRFLLRLTGWLGVSARRLVELRAEDGYESEAFTEERIIEAVCGRLAGALPDGRGWRDVWSLVTACDGRKTIG